MPVSSRIHQFEWILREPAFGEPREDLKVRPAMAELAEAETWSSALAPALSPLAQMLREEGIPKLLVREGEPAPSALDEAVVTLQVASEIEHAFLLQYLYAAFSLDASAGQASFSIVEVAKQEMAHLVTVQNLLIALGQSVDLNREDFPQHPELYPFPAELEPLSLDSLAKYVTAESPTVDQIPDADKELAEAAASRAAEAVQHKINRVGAIYAKLYWLFQEGNTPEDPWALPQDAIDQFVQLYGQGFHVRDQDFADSTTIGNFVAMKAEWGGDPSLHVDPSFPRSSALAAIATITAQGEGPNSNPNLKSHFEIFLDLYRSFAQLPPGTVKILAINPNTSGGSDPARTITQPATRLWAQLCNLRYQTLLLDIAIGMSIDRSKEPELRQKILTSWAVGVEMSEFIGPIASGLTAKPLTANASNALLAGAPFEFGDAIPTSACGRWKKQNALVQDSASVIASLKSVSGLSADEQQLLDAMASFDQQRQPLIAQKIQEFCGSS
jgi:hypothetical protein